MRAARKCSPTRGMRSTAFSTRRLRRPLRNLPQNRPELLIPQVSPVVAEGVFVKVGLQVLRAHAVIHAADPALHKTPESLNRLGVNVARDIDSRAVIDSPVNVSRVLQSVVRNVLIGINGARRKDVFLRQTVQSRLLRVRRYARYYAAHATVLRAFHHSDNCNLVAAIGRPSAPSLSLSLPAVVHLVHLHRRTLQLQTVLGQETPNLAEHAPRCFVGDASFPLNLLCGDAATSGTHEVHRVEPQLERGSGLLKHSASERVDMVSADLASIGGTTTHPMMLALYAALLAFGDSIRPTLLFDIFKAGVIIRKLSVELAHCVAKFLRDGLFGFHGSLNLLTGYQRAYLLSRDNCLS